MTAAAAHVLSTLDPARAWAQWVEGRWPKWSTQCFMHSVGLPVLDASLVAPGGEARLGEVAQQFAAGLGVDRVMVRSDGGLETARYRRGGHTLPVPEAVDWCREVMRDGRAALLLEPTDRFTNELTAMLRIDRTSAPAGLGRLTVEVLGPGYDLADLARTGLRPQARIEVRNVRWDRPDDLWPHDVSFATDDSSHVDRRDGRLDFIATQSMGLTGATREERLRAAREWLLVRGADHLFREWDPVDSVRHLTDWVAAAARVVGGWGDRPWECLATGWSDLDGTRQVFWDVVEGGSKYGHHG